MARTKSNRPLPTASERASKSLSELVARGGRRFNLKLSPEANTALKTILEVEPYDDETTAINQTLIARSKELIKKEGTKRRGSGPDQSIPENTQSGNKAKQNPKGEDEK